MSVDMPNYKISVITASYNYENYIKETIESVLNQTYNNWELIIADDGSSDNSVEIIKEYCKKDSRIKLFSHPDNQNLGLKDTLLLGLEKAQGEWVAFLESDDVFKPNALEEKIKIAQENADVKIIFSDVEMFGDEESIEKLNRYLEKSRCFLYNKKRLKENDLDFIVNRNFVPTFSCVMAKREKLLKCDFNTPVKQCLDIFLWAQFAACDFYYINKKLTKWRMHKTSYINSAASNINKNAEFTNKLSHFVYGNKKHSFLNRLKCALQYLNCLRKKTISIRFKAGEIILFNKKYTFKKIPSEIAKIDTNKNRIAVFAHWDKDCLIEDYVIYYLKSLKNIAQKIIFVSDCDVKKEELKKLNGIADVAIAKRHGEYDFGSYKRGFLYAKENNLLTGCDELIFANDSCYAPLFPFENMFAEMEKKQVDFWGNTINYEFSRHVQSYFLVFSPKVFNSRVFNGFVQNIKKENSKINIISNYEVKLTELLKDEGFKYSSYCRKNPQMLGLHIKNWKDLIKKDKSPFLKTSVPRLKNVELVSALCWKRILKKYTNYNTGLISKDLKRNRKKTDILKEIILTTKYLRKKIIRIHFKEKSVYLFGKKITGHFKLGASYNLFDGEELLEASIKSIRSQADYINVVYQDISNYGNKSETNLKPFLEGLMNKGLIDEIYLYKPNLEKNRAHKNKKDKRNIGLKLAKKRGCTHFLSMDVDEFYDSKQFAHAKEFIKVNCIKSSAVSIIEYIKKPTWQIMNGYSFSPDDNEFYTFYVPFIMKIKWHKQRHGKGFFPCFTDPTRILNGKDKFYLFPKHDIAMHHMSSIRKNLSKKYLNSSFLNSNDEICRRIKKLQEDILDFDFEKDKNNLPDVSCFNGKFIKKADNTFNISEESHA